MKKQHHLRMKVAPDQTIILGLHIPHICHFFTRAKFLDHKIYTVKRQFFRFKSAKNATFSRKICRKCQFFALNL